MARFPAKIKNSALWEFDRKYLSKYAQVIGVDEVGRGPLAGNVVSACVVLNLDEAISGIRDSKKIPEAKREDLAQEIKEKALAWSIGQCTPEEIDRLNILQATFISMGRALEKLSLESAIVLVDGNHQIPQYQQPQQCIVKGDNLSASIAAASILAKVERDRQMRELHKKFPEYGFMKNKGYGSRAHVEALRTFGPTPVHRKSFKVKSLTTPDLFPQG